MLRSGREIDNGVEILKETENQDPCVDPQSATGPFESIATEPILIPPSPSSVGKAHEKPSEDVVERTFVPKAPFPERLRNNKKKNHMDKFWETFSQV